MRTINTKKLIMATSIEVIAIRVFILNFFENLNCDGFDYITFIIKHEMKMSSEKGPGLLAAVARASQGADKSPDDSTPPQGSLG